VRPDLDTGVNWDQNRSEDGKNRVENGFVMLNKGTPGSDPVVVVFIKKQNRDSPGSETMQA